MQDHMPDSPDSFLSHTCTFSLSFTGFTPYSTALPSITAEPFLRHRQQIHLAKQTGQTIPITTGLTRTTYRIKAILEAVTARYIRIVFLQARKHQEKPPPLTRDNTALN